MSSPALRSRQMTSQWPASPRGNLTGTINVDGPGSSLTLNGSSALTLGNALEGTATINVTNSGMFTTGAGASPLDLIDTTGTLNVNTAGTFNALENVVLKGMINLDGGTIDAHNITVIGGTVNFTSGTLELGSNQTLDAAKLAGLDVATLTAGKTFRVDGFLLLTAPLQLDGGLLSIDSVPGDLLQLGFSAGTLELTSDDLVVGAAGALGANVTIDGDETLRLTGVGKTLTVDVGSTLTVAGGGFELNGATNNSGTVTISNTTSDFMGGLTNNNADLVLIGATFNGDISNPAGSALTVVGSVTHNGSLSGAGGIFGPGTLTISGLHSPGDSAAVAPVEGNIVYSSASTLMMELGGDLLGEFDRLEIGGTATLDGTLDVALINPFFPTPGEAFEIMTFGSRSGEFANVTGDVGLLDPVTFLLPLYSSTNLLLFTAIPGDGNLSGAVEAADYTLWANGFGSGTPTFETGDYNGDGSTDAADYTTWANNFGMMAAAPAGAPAAVPEPSTFVLAAIGFLGLNALRCRRFVSKTREA